MALIKLSEDVIFSKEVLPICLPGSELFPDEKGEVYVAGWGSLADKNCTTGKYGPNPYTICAPNFKYQNKTYSECAETPSPSSNDLLCQQLVKSNHLTIFPEPGYTQTDIFDASEKLLTTCYNFPLDNKGPYGWCATCQKHAMPGQPGYCGSYPFDNNEEHGIPTAVEGWGYCEKQCSENFTYNQALLQEVQMELLSVDDCKKMTNLSLDILDIELCAAKQVCKYLLEYSKSYIYISLIQVLFSSQLPIGN